MISVMVVDDQRYERLGLALMLKGAESIRIVAQAENGREAVDALAAASGDEMPDVVLMDVRMPMMDGIDATRIITRAHPGVKVLVLTTYDQDDYALGGLSAGVSGFLLKDVTSAELADAVRAVASGDAVLTPRITRKVLGRCFPSSPLASPRGSAPTHKGSFSSLTPREAEVASLVADGFSNAEIAERLVVEPASVRRYVSRILAKTGLRDRVQVAVAWVRAKM